MPAPATQLDLPAPPESRDPAVLVDVLVLSADLLLFEAIRGAIGERNPVWRARSAEESVDLLLTGRCGVLLVDMAAVSTKPDTLISQIVDQFPDVVVVVAGRREDESLLAQLISDGLVYRFMHKPLTAKRAGMFLQAAIRRHAEQRAARATQPLLPLAKVLPARFDPRKWLFVAAGLALFVGALALLAGGGRDAARGSGAVEAVPPAVAPVSPQADPVLSRARAAFAAGRYEAPAGRNALDLYAAVLLSRPDAAEARAGLDATVDRVVSVARLAAADGNLPEAQRLLARVQAVDGSNPAVKRLAAHLARKPSLPNPGAGSSAGSPAVVTASQPPLPSHGAAADTPTTSQIAANSRQAETPVAARAPTVVTPDPLTPRIVNADEIRSSTLKASRRPSRSYGSPVSTGLPIAGYVKSRPVEVPVAPRPTGSLDAATVAALAMPADELERIHATDPVYPAAALRDHVEGWVELMFTITETGTVRDVEVIDAQPHGVFESAATDAVSAWRFRPRLANGQPVPRRSTVTLRFNVEG